MPCRHFVLRPLSIVAACLVLAACASGGPPAPIVPRTTPGAAAVPAPAAPSVPPAPVAAPVVPTPPVPEAPVVATAPVRSGSVESRGIESRPPGPSAPASSAMLPPPAPTLPPNTRTGPRGVKVPFSESALAELRSAEAPAAGAAAAAGAGAAIAPAAGAPGTPPPPAAVAAVPPVKPADGKAEAPLASSPANAAGGADAWAWPTSGRMVQTFEESSKKGIAFSGKAGDPVMAAADGRVIFSGNGPRGYGNLVIVKHANDLLSVYAHNRSLAVKEGQDVKRGQKIAEVGDSGTTSARLHFEIRQQGKPVDPTKFLPRR
jgi:lipoprotein NlpD